MLKYFDMPVDLDALHHRFGAVEFGSEHIVRVAKEYKLKARSISVTPDRLKDLPFPGIIPTKDGRFIIAGKVSDKGVLIQDPESSRPEMLSWEAFERCWLGTVILLAKRASLSDVARRFNVLWFVGAMHKYRRIFGEVLVVSFFVQLFGLVTPLFFQVVTDKVLAHRGYTTLDVLVFALVAVSIFETILSGLRTYVFAHTTNRIDVELGARLYKHLISLPISYFEARRAGDSVARVRELENIRNFLTSSALTLVVDLAFTVIFVAVLFYYSPPLAWIVVGAIPIYFAISAAVSPIFRSRLDRKFDKGAENQAFLVESVSAIHTLKAMAVEPQMQRRWEEQLASYVQSSFSVLSLGNVTSQLVQLVSKIVTALTLYFGALQVMDGALSVGGLIAFNMLAGRVAQPILRLAQLWQDFHQTRISIERLGDILNTATEPSLNTSRSNPPSIKGAVTFERVGFRYRLDGPRVLDEISLKVQPGQVVGIVGPSGSGKSTLTKLIQRLYVPENGRILIDGVDISLTDVAWLRRQIGAVLQENVLFNRSIRDNIALAEPSMSMDQVVAAAELAGAHEFVAALPDGYDTVVGERGASLSGGQRQRIAIARALVNDPRILIFDEATSALDYESESVIQRNMRQMAVGRTVFIIAHRLSAVRHADRILTIEAGRLVEDGTHEELIVRSGRYATLHQLQAGLHVVS
jgi:subfamily B ATP-binding cassette protein HlyB/CyaB